MHVTLIFQVIIVQKWMNIEEMWGSCLSGELSSIEAQLTQFADIFEGEIDCFGENLGSYCIYIVHQQS